MLSWYLVPSLLTSNEMVLGVNSVSCKVFQVNTELIFSTAGQAVYLIKSEPKFTTQITEPSLVVGPVTVEINRAVHSLLEYCPPSPG